MKGKAWEFLKALGAAVYLGALVIFGIAALVSSFFPAAVPGWMIIGMIIVYVPFWIVFLVTVIREGHKKRKAKKDKKKKK